MKSTIKLNKPVILTADGRNRPAPTQAGIVSQNISIFCASVGLDTRVRAWMDKEKLREILKLKDTQHLMLNNPVGYKKD